MAEERGFEQPPKARLGVPERRFIVS